MTLTPRQKNDVQRRANQLANLISGHPPPIVLSWSLAFVLETIHGGRWRALWWLTRHLAGEAYQERKWRLQWWWHEKLMRRSKDETARNILRDDYIDDYINDYIKDTADEWDEWDDIIDNVEPTKKR